MCQKSVPGRSTFRQGYHGNEEGDNLTCKERYLLTVAKLKEDVFDVNVGHDGPSS